MVMKRRSKTDRVDTIGRQEEARSTEKGMARHFHPQVWTRLDKDGAWRDLGEHTPMWRYLIVLNIVFVECSNLCVQ